MIASDSGAGSGVLFGAEGVDEATEMRFSDEVGLRVMSISCHQSNSATCLTPESLNHYSTINILLHM